MADTNTNQSNDDNLIFEINDDLYLIHSIAYELIPGIIILTAILIFGFIPSNFLFKVIAGPLSIYAIVGSLFKILTFYKDKNKKIKFYSKKIVRTNKQLNIAISDIREVYKPFFFNNSYMSYSGIRRFGDIRKFFFFIFSPIFLITYFLYYISSVLYYKNFMIYQMIEVIGKDDKKVIKIQLPFHKSDRKRVLLLQYFKEHLNINLDELKNTLFINMKG
jgi:hypothetical protein